MIRDFAISSLVGLALAAPVCAEGIQLTGEAEMGLVGGANYPGGTQFISSIDLNFSASHTLDNGLTIGFQADLSDLLQQDSDPWPPITPTRRGPAADTDRLGAAGAD